MADRSALSAGESISLLAAIAAGDRTAFRLLYDSSAAKLFGACSRILIERSEAEEAVQDAYLAIWRRAGSFDPARGSATAWMLTIARNCAVDRLRARGKIASAPLDAADDIADPAPLAGDVLEGAQTGRRLHDCLGALEMRDVMLIRAAFFQGSTYQELATRGALPLGTVKSRIRRALMRLAECMA